MGQVRFSLPRSTPTQADTPGRCIFCGKLNPAATLIWPNWLDLAFPEETAEPAGSSPPDAASAPSECTTHPMLACAECNTGWITTLGEKARQFMEPAMGSGQPSNQHPQQVTLNQDQVKTLAGCASLIAMKAAFVARHCGISPGERTFLRHTGQPTRNWSIFIAGLSGAGWSKAMRHHSYRIEFAGNPLTTRSSSYWIKDCNTQLFSIGMGPLFLHMFISPSLILMNDFNVSAKAQGLQQLWPPTRRFGMLPQQVKIPPSRTLTDDEAHTIATRFAEDLHTRLSPNKAQSRISPLAKTS